jgi:hypothetical protein
MKILSQALSIASALLVVSASALYLFEHFQPPAHADDHIRVGYVKRLRPVGWGTVLEVTKADDGLYSLSSSLLPPYPEHALLYHTQGNVSIRVTVDHGRVTSATPESGDSYLADLTATWIKAHWEYGYEATLTYSVPIAFIIQ